MEQIINSICDLIYAWSQTILPEDTAIAIVESCKDVFVRFYILAWEYINILGG